MLESNLTIDNREISRITGIKITLDIHRGLGQSILVYSVPLI